MNARGEPPANDETDVAEWMFPDLPPEQMTLVLAIRKREADDARWEAALAYLRSLPARWPSNERPSFRALDDLAERYLGISRTSPWDAPGRTIGTGDLEAELRRQFQEYAAAQPERLRRATAEEFAVRFPCIDWTGLIRWDNSAPGAFDHAIFCPAGHALNLGLNARDNRNPLAFVLAWAEEHNACEPKP